MGWQRHRQAEEDRIVMSFDGKLTAEEGAASAKAFAEAASPHEKVDAVWDIRRMTGYERAAREAWQSTLWPLRQKIRRVTVVGGKPLVRLGATTLGLALGVQISFRDELDVQAA
jgi:hypothetical protein